MRRSLILVILLVCIISAPSFANLLTNGDFDSGNINGWNIWKAGWGGGNHAVAQSSVKYQGNGALNLYIDSGQSTSFGVYQQVTVTPGTRYKVSGFWKGTYSPSTSNWFEVILIDGAFSLYAADDPNGVKPNLAAVYDPAYRVFDWEDISKAYPLTSNVVKGERTATGSTMTVVLKVGGFGAPSGYFDNVNFDVVPEPSSLAALAGGLLGLAGIYRRRK